MRVRATVNLPGNSPGQPFLMAGMEAIVDLTDPWIEKLYNAGYLVATEAQPTPNLTEEETSEDSQEGSEESGETDQIPSPAKGRRKRVTDADG